MDSDQPSDAASVSLALCDGGMLGALCLFCETVECAVLVKASDLCSILLFWKYCAWVRASLLPLEREMPASPSAPTRNSVLVSVLLL